MSEEKAVKDFFKGVSENKRMYFVGTTTKDAIKYHVGEEMVFKIRVKTDDGYIFVPFVSYSLQADDVSFFEFPSLPKLEISLLKF